VEEAEGVLFLTMELVEGKPLGDLIVKGGYFVGTRRFSSSNQFCTRIMFEVIPLPVSAWSLRMI
jgi:hypothetical protein